MSITSKDFASKGYDYKIDLASEKGGIWLSRTFALKSGETLAFNIQLIGHPDMSLEDLHQQSIERAIQLLQAALQPTPETPQSPSPNPLVNRLA